MKKLSTSFDGCIPIRAPLIALLVFEFCALILHAFSYLALRDSGSENLLARNISGLVVPVVLGILMLPIIRNNWAAMREQLSFKSMTWQILLGSLLLGIVMRAVWWAIRLEHEFPNTGELPQFLFQCPNLYLTTMKVFVIAVSTPFIEEVFMRGFLLRVLLPRGGLIAVLISSGLFGLIHKPEMIMFATVAGFCFALLYVRIRILWAPITAHATFNLLSVFDQMCMGLIWPEN
jgi:membrane protease YdiL (CAAX protease family)